MPHGDIHPTRWRLRADRPLTHEEGACLPLRSRHGQCQACAQACPVGALSVSLREVSLSDACTGCGLCTAVCPTEALVLPEMGGLLQAFVAAGPAQPEAIQPARPPVRRIECRLVPASLRQEDTMEVPCLGALRASHLVAQAAAGVQTELVDRGWCLGCPVSCLADDAPHPARPAADEATAWLESVGSALLPRLVTEPLPLDERPTALPGAAPEPPRLDRRRFFREALERPAGRSTAQPTPMGGDGKAAYPVDRRQPSPDRQRLLAALAVVAERHDAELPAELYPVLSTDERCCDQRLCVALCPTAALSVHDNGVGAHLRFDSERCIACGTCVRSCPEGALHLAPTGGRRGSLTLVSHHRRSCPTCGDSFSPTAQQVSDDNTALCPACSKSQRFMDDARRQLFGQLN